MKLRGDYESQDEDSSRIVGEWASERWIDRTLGTALRSQGGKFREQGEEEGKIVGKTGRLQREIWGGGIQKLGR